MAPSICAVKYSTKRISVMRNVSNVAMLVAVTQVKLIEVGEAQRGKDMD